MFSGRKTCMLTKRTTAELCTSHQLGYLHNRTNGFVLKMLLSFFRQANWRCSGIGSWNHQEVFMTGFSIFFDGNIFAAAFTTNRNLRKRSRVNVGLCEKRLSIFWLCGKISTWFEHSICMCIHDQGTMNVFLSTVVFPSV